MGALLFSNACLAFGLILITLISRRQSRTIRRIEDANESLMASIVNMRDKKN